MSHSSQKADHHRPDLQLLWQDQLDRIREDLRQVQATRPEVGLTDGDIHGLTYLALTVRESYRPGRGHDCSWIYTNDIWLVTGHTDVYGNGDSPSVAQIGDWWTRIDDNDEDGQ